MTNNKPVSLSDILGSSISTSDSNSTDLSNRSLLANEENVSIEEPYGSNNRGSYDRSNNTTNENLDEQPSNSAHTTNSVTAKPKKNRRKPSKPSDWKLIKDMLHLQGTVHYLIPKLSFGRVIREILSEFAPTGLRVTPQALECLQESAELYTVQLFQDAYRCTFHRDRITLQPKDIQLALMLRREL
uniref:Core Histone H2A/H2B/H3 domain-containing protein n=1 Tax=Anopheles farauti TaxID=69004 RepID=A0A182QFH7_9DIPT